MKLLTMTFFIHLCAGFAASCAMDHDWDASSYRIQYKDQRWVDKQLVKKVKNRETSAKTIKMFLWLKADPNAIDKKGMTAFNHLFTSIKPSLKKVKLFLKHNVDCNKMSVSLRGGSLRAPLEYISSGCQYVDIIPFIKLVLFHKADPNHINSKGTPLLHYVLWRGKSYECLNGDPISLIKDIVSYKGDVNIRDSEYDETPFHVLCFENRYNELITYFLEARGDANSKNRSGFTPFKYFLKNHKATCDIDRNILSAFIECKVDLTYLLKTSLESYKRGYHYNSKETLDFIFFLLEKKANLNAINAREKFDIYHEDMFTPDLIKYFLDYNLDPTTDIGYEWVMFGYECVCNKSKEKRNMLAYAIPFFIRQKYIQQWRNLLLCLHVKKELCPSFNVPKYLRMALCGDVAVRIDWVLKEIQKIEEDVWWAYDDNAVRSLKKNICEEVRSLKNNICELISMSNIEKRQAEKYSKK